MLWQTIWSILKTLIQPKNRQKKSCKSIEVYYIGYITIKKNDDYENVDIVNSLYLIIREVNGYIKEKNGNKYLTFENKIWSLKV